MKFVIFQFLPPPVSSFSFDSIILVSILSPNTSSLVYFFDAYSSKHLKIHMQLVCPVYAVTVGLQLGTRLQA
jgi:hypothetical protein